MKKLTKNIILYVCLAIVLISTPILINAVSSRFNENKIEYTQTPKEAFLAYVKDLHNADRLSSLARMKEELESKYNVKDGLLVVKLIATKIVYYNKLLEQRCDKYNSIVYDEFLTEDNKQNILKEFKFDTSNEVRFNLNRLVHKASFNYGEWFDYLDENDATVYNNTWYRCPADLKYLFLYDATKASTQTYLLAPDLYGREVEWNVSFINDTTIELYSVTNKKSFTISDVVPFIIEGKIKTGDLLGKAQGCLEELKDGNVKYGCIKYYEYEEGNGVEKNYSFLDLGKKPVKASSYTGSGNWKVTTYYSPVAGQTKYFNGSHARDTIMNCGCTPTRTNNCDISCSVPKAGIVYKQEDRLKYAACDRRYYKKSLKITMPDDHPVHPGESLVVTCVDVGGKVNHNHIDLWVGFGTKGGGTPWIGEWSTKKAKVEIL